MILLVDTIDCDASRIESIDSKPDDQSRNDSLESKSSTSTAQNDKFDSDPYPIEIKIFYESDRIKSNNQCWFRSYRLIKSSFFNFKSISKRFLLLAVCMTMNSFSYMIRTNINLTIVAMVNGNSAQNEIVSDNSTERCLRSDSIESNEVFLEDNLFDMIV